MTTINYLRVFKKACAAVHKRLGVTIFARIETLDAVDWKRSPPEADCIPHWIISGTRRLRGGGYIKRTIYFNVNHHPSAHLEHVAKMAAVREVLAAIAERIQAEMECGGR